jgi:hypothetical protein
MQRAIALFLALILSMFSMHTTGASTFSPGEDIAQNSMTKANNKTNSHDCCQQSCNNCSKGRCDCDTGHSSNPLLITPSILLSFNKHPTPTPSLSSGFISHPSSSLYRPPRISC